MPDELRVFLLVPLLFAVVGAGLAWSGLHSRRAVRAFRRRAVSVPAVCVSVRWEWRSVGPQPDQIQLFFPTLRYRGPDGRDLEAETVVGTNPSGARQGQEVTALYDPEDPRRVRVDGFWADGTLVNWFLVVFGGLFAVGGLAVLAAAIALGALA